MAVVLSLVVNSTSSIALSVTGRTAVDNLEASDIKIFLSANGTAAFASFTDFTLSGATATTATIVPNSAFNTADVITVQMNDTAETSNRDFVDFSSAFSSGAGTVVYSVPATPATYTINNTQVNDEAVAFSSIAYVASNKPLGANCSMTLPKNYLVKFVGNKYNLSVILKDSSNAAVSDGNYELVYTEA